MKTRVTAIMVAAALALTGCMPVAPDGPSGVVADHYRKWIHKKGWGYRVVVKPDAGGEPVTIAIYRSQRDTCAVGDRYPKCLEVAR